MTDEGLIAGWYPHKDHPDALRYWDGSKWTDSFKPADGESSVRATTRQASNDRGTESLAVVGIFALLFFPLASFVIGFIVAARNRPWLGIGMVAASVGSTWLWWMILFSE